MSKKKKSKKRKILMAELNWMIDRNKYFCVRNNIDSTEYMEGVNDTAKKMKKMVKKLYK
jgi:hypothetical protein